MEDTTRAEMIVLMEIKRTLDYERFYLIKRLEVIFILLLANYAGLMILLFFNLFIK